MPGQVSADLFEGYDPELKRWKKVCFWSHGGTTTVLMELNKDAEGDARTLEGTARDVDTSGFARDTGVKYYIRKDSWEVHRDDGAVLRYTRKPTAHVRVE